MQRKIILILRELEKESGLKNEYTEFFDQFQCDYEVEEYIDFPNYRLITRRFNERYPRYTSQGFVLPTADSAIKAELKRMAADHLVMIDVQQGQKYATTPSNNGPDFDEAISFTTESVVLTTKGKSEWRYFIYALTKDPLAVLAILISVASLIISIVK